MPAWSADGRLLAFVTGADVILAIDAASNVITPVGSGQFFRWAPHRQDIALLDEGRLLIAVIGVAPRQIVSWEDVVSVSWSPDGERLAVGRSNHEIWLVSRNGAGSRKLADGDGPVWASAP
jgi:dipeptidyl aminopeptidase/acylaminoacyl peptidase